MSHGMAKCVECSENAFRVNMVDHLVTMNIKHKSIHCHKSQSLEKLERFSNGTATGLYILLTLLFITYSQSKRKKKLYMVANGGEDETNEKVKSEKKII